MSRRTLAIAGEVRRRPRSNARGESLMDVTDKKNTAAQAPEGDEGEYGTSSGSEEEEVEMYESSQGSGVKTRRSRG